ncbi:MAG: EAL domain-containing protein [Spirochaetes bacterium]|nr:EAL domain-containing protein [Spirochaetota bacterium]
MEKNRKHPLIEEFTFFSISVLVALVSFAFINAVLGDYPKAIIDMLMAVFLAAALITVHAVKSNALVIITIRSLIAICMVFLLTMFVTGGYAQSGIFWVAVFPIMAFYFDGKTNGVRWVFAFFFVSSVATALIMLNILPSVYNYPAGWTTVQQAYLIFLLLSVLTYRYALRHDKDNEAIASHFRIDQLTGLPNRTQLLDDVHASTNPTLVLMNIDRFKDINHFFGNDIGNLVLAAIAGKMTAFSSHDHVCLYKLHADEYAFLAEGMTLDDVLEKVRYYHAFIENTFYAHDDYTISVNVTFGIAQGKENLIEHADMALKTARAENSEFSVYNGPNTLDERYRQSINWTRKIKENIMEQRVVPYYQPIVNVKTGVVEKYECLVRIIERDGTVVLPEVFLDVARYSKFYSYITRMMVRKSFDTFKDKPYEFSINLTAEDISNVATVQYIKTKLADYGIAGRTVFEITESENVKNYELVSKFIAEMRTLGCKFAIDDFGSGFSNFAHLIQLHVDYLKIDGSLVKNIDTDPASRAIVETIVTFAGKLGMHTIAEYVHSSAVFDAIRTCGIEYSQGFYHNKPLPGLSEHELPNA